MRARTVVFALFAAVVVSGGVLLVAKLARERRASLRPTIHEAATSTKTSTKLRDALSPPGTPESSPGIDPSTARRESSDTTAAPEQPQASTRVEGILIVTDSRGVEHAS